MVKPRPIYQENYEYIRKTTSVAITGLGEALKDIFYVLYSDINSSIDLQKFQADFSSISKLYSITQQIN